MNTFLHGVVRAVAESFPLPEPILEIGSYQVEGQENIINLRGLFPEQTYIGLDMRQGPGVDVVGDAESLPYDDASVGTVLSVSTLEHVPRFWRAFDEIRRVLRPDGVCLVTVPFYFYVHGYPSDYWRFTPEAIKLLLEPYSQHLIGSHGPQRRIANVWGLGFREQYPQIHHTQVDRYKQLMGKYAHEPLRTVKHWRYRVGQWLFGQRPFAPYLQMDDWRLESCSPVAGDRVGREAAAA